MPVTLNTGKVIQSHEDLNITFREWAAMFGVALALHDGLIAMHRNGRGPEGGHFFNMNGTCIPNGHCGSIGCIGGYVGMTMGKSTYEASDYVFDNENGGPFDELYFPKFVDDYGTVTPRQAAAAICNFLSTGDPGWRNAIAADHGAARRKAKVIDHRELGTTFSQWMALLSIRAMLDVGALAYDGKADIEPAVHKFNMGIAALKHDCGTVGCIGGYVGLLNGMTAGLAADFVGGVRGALYALFYPSYRGRECTYADIKPAQAVKAIDNYLSTGKPRWHEVLGTDRAVWY
jgi:hypothetical protein